ncbi:MAG: hypothetical protein Q7S22_04080 [Candidatus Micrarchaeota archaeon]|nr:hypothetical protein [Candidatus Micrarchaeota archaeon]
MIFKPGKPGDKPKDIASPFKDAVHGIKLNLVGARLLLETGFARISARDKPDTPNPFVKEAEPQFGTSDITCIDGRDDRGVDLVPAFPTRDGWYLDSKPWIPTGEGGSVESFAEMKLSQTGSPSFKYTSQPLDLYGGEKTTVGIGKNEDGYRVVWDTGKGLEIYDNSGHSAGDLSDFDSKCKITLFKIRLIEEVKTNPLSEKSVFIRAHAVEMGLEFSK